ncbi:MAG: YfiR family protein, partial [Terriglobia bacterium]
NSDARSLTRHALQSDGIPRQQGRRLRAAAIAVAWTLISVPVSHTQPLTPTEYEVKAAYLFNLGKFVEWPAQAAVKEDSFPICVLGADPFGQVLDAAIAGETIGGKTVIAKRISKPQDATGCRILFISSSEEGCLQEILANLDGTSVLTVSDMPDFGQRGGMIHLVLENRKVRFAVNLTAAERAGLTLSSQLLKLAVRVTGKPRPTAGAGAGAGD